MGGPSAAAKQLVRDYSLEIESKMTTDVPPERLELAVVETCKEEDERNEEMAEWRNYFEPWPVSKLVTDTTQPTCSTY